MTSLTEIGEARNKIFSHKLDEVSGTSTGGSSSTIDPKGYLTELSSVVIKSDAEIGDIKKARGLLDSVIKTNPKHAPGWIAAARLEEHAGKMAVARKVIAQACEQCPKSEDVWLESARLNVSATLGTQLLPLAGLTNSFLSLSSDATVPQTNENAKVILARAVTHLSQSVKIWLKAVELEHQIEAKKRVLRKCEFAPNCAIVVACNALADALLLLSCLNSPGIHSKLGEAMERAGEPGRGPSRRSYPALGCS